MAKALLGGLSAILVVAVVVGVVATVTRSGKKAGDNFNVPGEASLATSGKSVKSLCAPTLYKESCEKTLSQATNGTENPKEVFHSVAKVALESVKTAVEQSKNIGEAKASDSMTESAREDCKKLLEDAVDDLRGMLEMAGGDIKVLFSRSDDLETWLTGVMTFMDTCIDGFVDEKLKADMHSVLRNATELSSNALAITNSLGGILKKLDLDMFKKDSRRRLLSEQDEKGWPVWMRSPERKLLAAGNQPKPNAVVAKDGSGQFKTIQQAVDAVPKGQQGRYVIYVKAGLYDEIVMVPKDKVNIFMYGDGPKQTRVTGKKSFADGITTMKTATFCEKQIFFFFFVLIIKTQTGGWVRLFDGWIRMQPSRRPGSSARTWASTTRPARRSTRRWRSACRETSRRSTTAGSTRSRTRCTCTPGASSSATASSPARSTSSSATRRRCSRTASSSRGGPWTTSRTR
jgi:pectinesterase inhibitor-like protein